MLDSKFNPHANTNPSIQKTGKYRKTYKGLFIPKYPKKYIGDSNRIVFRSLWERQMMDYFDNNSFVIAWGSEELIIPYLSPVDGKVHRYFPDFIAKMKDSKGNIHIKIFEVKPKKQTMMPEGKTMNKRLMEEMATYAVNHAKFEAAHKFCKEKGWEFVVVTEDFLI